jgi:hypothetical protein
MERLVWRKATKSGQNGGCVEVLMLPDGSVKVRDTKAGGHGPVLSFTPAEWDAFLDGAKLGEFDN